MHSLRRISEDFNKEDVPAFACPRCQHPLAVRPDGLKLDQSAESEFHTDNSGDPTMYCGVFTMRMICSRGSCKERVVCVGSFVTTQEEGRFGEPDYPHVLSPKFFFPTVCLFPISPRVPDRIKISLMDSFSTFWNNPGAAGNSVRISVEALMDHLRVSKWYRDRNGKRRAYDLHARIEMYRKSAPSLGDKLLAVKWLGNSGSHLTGLTKGNVIDGYEMYSFVLEELFEKRTASLTRMAKRINRRRGPVS